MTLTFPRILKIGVRARVTDKTRLQQQCERNNNWLSQAKLSEGTANGSWKILTTTASRRPGCMHTRGIGKCNYRACTRMLSYGVPTGLVSVVQSKSKIQFLVYQELQPILFPCSMIRLRHVKQKIEGLVVYSIF